MHGGKNTVQKCYNCGKEVDDNVLICPECGALVKRYGKPEPQQAEPFESQGTAFTQPPQPHAAVWQREDGKLKFSGGVTFWLVLCAIFLGYTLLGFACTLFIYRFQAAYFQTISQFQELAPLAELLQALLASVEAYPVYYLAVAALVALQFGCVIWFRRRRGGWRAPPSPRPRPCCRACSGSSPAVWARWSTSSGRSRPG